MLVLTEEGVCYRIVVKLRVKYCRLFSDVLLRREIDVTGSISGMLLWQLSSTRMSLADDVDNMLLLVDDEY